jgi:UDP-2,4-diacetamido-2,4,6-trideoxy-beta-L-altropyranose hydrolase
MRLLIRADATVEMGTGHVMRCIALGQAWQDAGGTVEFLTECDSDALVDRLQTERFFVRRLSSGSGWRVFREACRETPPAAVVLDGYHFDAEDQKRVRDCVRPLLVVDDLARLSGYSADLVLNQNIYAAELDYQCESHTRLLLGCQWVLLRREFRRWRGWRREIPRTARKLLIVLGGSDPANITLRVVHALRSPALPRNLETLAVVGGANPHAASLREAVRGLPRIEIRGNVSDMPALMAWADVAITGAGSTCWEMAFMGLPFSALILADNQERVANSLEAAGVARNLGRGELAAPETVASAVGAMARSRPWREKLNGAGRRLVLGDGAEAAVAAIRGLL